MWRLAIKIIREEVFPLVVLFLSAFVIFWMAGHFASNLNAPSLVVNIGQLFISLALLIPTGFIILKILKIFTKRID